MKRFSFLVLALVCFVISNAQFKIVGESQTFEEPGAGFAKLIQLKNGNTFLLRFTEKDGIYVRLFDAMRKEGTEVHIEPLYKKLKNIAVQSVFEVGGDIVVFASSFGTDSPAMYRMIIDGNSGKLKEDKVLFTMAKLSSKEKAATESGDAPFPLFSVTHDSEGYAVALQNTFAADKSQRLEVYHYGADHNVINHAYCKLQGNCKFASYVTLQLMGKESVCVMVREYNNYFDGAQGSETSLVTISSNSVKATKLDFCQNTTSVRGLLEYNPATTKIVAVVSVQETKNDKGYTQHICYLDPTSNKVESSGIISPTAASAKSADLFKDKKGFVGLPQAICMNRNGSFAIVSEESSFEVVTSNSGFSVPTATLGNIAISTYSSNGAEIGSYLIPMAHFLRGQYGQGFYLDNGDIAPVETDLGNHFRSFLYLVSENGNYILFNDLKENEERVSQGKRPTTVSSVPDCDAYVYSIEGKNIMPTRKYVFGEPAKSQHNLAAFAMSDYDKNRNTLVTLKLNLEGKRKTANLVWLQPS
ncbi:hypothetical protein QEG73_19100 [Chitinophagaceae bacterium 26-R-25]|nr:hypothetical protein [Chitinophagaceae bacterium 26-R-25]